MNKQCGVHIPPPNNIDELLPTSKGNGDDRTPPENRTIHETRYLTKTAKTKCRQTSIQSITKKAPGEPHTEVCTFEETISATLFAKKNYKVAISIGLAASRKRLMNCHFDTGAGSSLLLEELLETNWLPLIRPCYRPQLRRVTNPKVEIVGTIMLHFQIGDSRVRGMFGILSHWPVPTLLGTTFIAKCNNVIFLTHWRIFPFNSRPVAVLVVLGATSVETCRQLTEAVVSIWMLQDQKPSLVHVTTTVALQRIA